MSNAIFIITYLLSNTLAVVEEASRKEVVVKQVPEIKCEIGDGEESNCEKCVGKGMKCFWCESTQKCTQYQWNFPNCQLRNVRTSNCWTDWSIVIVILGATFLGIIFGAICCCFTMCIDCCQQTRHTTRRSKVTETKIAMQHRHEQRRMERKAVKDNIRKKYGIPLSSPAFEKFK